MCHLLGLRFPSCQRRELGQATLRLESLPCSAHCLNEMSGDDKLFQALLGARQQRAFLPGGSLVSRGYRGALLFARALSSSQSAGARSLSPQGCGSGCVSVRTGPGRNVPGRV